MFGVAGTVQWVMWFGMAGEGGWGCDGLIGFAFGKLSALCIMWASVALPEIKLCPVKWKCRLNHWPSRKALLKRKCLNFLYTRLPASAPACSLQSLDHEGHSFCSGDWGQGWKMTFISPPWVLLFAVAWVSATYLITPVHVWVRHPPLPILTTVPTETPLSLNQAQPLLPTLVGR